MKKPVLHRETVRVLDERRLHEIRGGGNITDGPDPVTIELKGKQNITEGPDPVGGH